MKPCKPKWPIFKQGTEAIEEQARDRLGMVKAGETFYQVIDDKSNSNATANAVEGVQIVDTPIDESRPGTTTNAPSAAPKQ